MSRHRSLRGLSLLKAIGDSAPRQIIRGKLYSNPIPEQDPDVVSAHLPRKVGQHDVVILQLDTKLGSRQGLHNQTFNFNLLFLFSHKVFD